MMSAVPGFSYKLAHSYGCSYGQEQLGLRACSSKDRRKFLKYRRLTFTVMAVILKAEPTTIPTRQTTVVGI